MLRRKVRSRLREKCVMGFVKGPDDKKQGRYESYEA